MDLGARQRGVVDTALAIEGDGAGVGGVGVEGLDRRMRDAETADRVGIGRIEGEEQGCVFRLEAESDAEG